LSLPGHSRRNAPRRFRTSQYGQAALRMSASEIVSAEILPMSAILRGRYPSWRSSACFPMPLTSVEARGRHRGAHGRAPAHEALVVGRIGPITLGRQAHRHYLDRAGRPRSLEDLRQHSLIGFDVKRGGFIRSMRQRVEGGRIDAARDGSVRSAWPFPRQP
jgi:hypothetical protein